MDFKGFPLTPSPVGFLLFLQHSFKLGVRSRLVMKPEEMAGVESSLASLFKQKNMTSFAYCLPWRLISYEKRLYKCGYSNT